MIRFSLIAICGFSCQPKICEIQLVHSPAPLQTWPQIDLHLHATWWHATFAMIAQSVCCNYLSNETSHSRDESAAQLINIK